MKIPLLLVVMMMGCAGKQKDPPKTDPSMQLMPIRSHDETHPPRLPDCPCAGKDLNQHCWMKAGEIQYPEGCTFLHAKKFKPAAPRVAPVNDAEEGWKGNPRVVQHQYDPEVNPGYKPYCFYGSVKGICNPPPPASCADTDSQCLYRQKKAQSIMMNEALPEKQEEPQTHCLSPEGCYRPPPPQMPPSCEPYWDRVPCLSHSKHEEPSDSHQAWLKDCLKTGDCPDSLPMVIHDFVKDITISYSPKTTAITVTTPSSTIVVTPKEKP